MNTHNTNIHKIYCYEHDFTLKWRHNVLLGLWIFLATIAHYYVFHFTEELCKLEIFIWDTLGIEQYIKLVKNHVSNQWHPWSGDDACSASPYLAPLQHRQHACIAICMLSVLFIIVHQTRCTCIGRLIWIFSSSLINLEDLVVKQAHEQSGRVLWLAKD